MNILITGSAGFIGANLVLRLLDEGLNGENIRIVGLDNLNDYYDPALKKYRLKQIEERTITSHLSTFNFIKGDIADKTLIDNLFAEEQFDIVVNLAAQAGVRYSITNPDAYIQSNIIGFYNILEACRHSKELVTSHLSPLRSAQRDACPSKNSPLGSAACVEKSEQELSPVRSGQGAACPSKNSPLGPAACLEKSEQELSPVNSQLSPVNYSGVRHLVYASSSSVYGGNKKVPFSTDDRVDNPVSLYAATKKSNELLAHAYSKLYNIPSTGLRFFTVYGPAGRPDMAYFGFTNKLVKGETIQIFNYGNCKRDFTYVDDIVEGIIRVMQAPPQKAIGDDGLPIPPYKVYNIGGGQPENLLDFVTILQEELVRAKVLPSDFNFEEHKQLVAMQPGDVPTTYADASALERDFGFTPKITLREGLRKFAEWYASFYTS